MIIIIDYYHYMIFWTKNNYYTKEFNFIKFLDVNVFQMLTWQEVRKNNITTTNHKTHTRCTHKRATLQLPFT